MVAFLHKQVDIGVFMDNLPNAIPEGFVTRGARKPGDSGDSGDWAEPFTTVSLV